jgi:DNA uptake protein ComE-like DNA-binding protein
VAPVTSHHPEAMSVGLDKTGVQRPRWVWISLIPLGVGAWAPIYAGLKARSKAWILLGLLWTLITLAGWIGSAGRSNAVAGMLIILGWVGGAATSFSIRGAYEKRLASPLLQATVAAQDRLDRREQARRLAARDPKLAAEAGIGRPDEAGSIGGGLIDVNNASVAALMTLPGVDAQLATQIVEARTEGGGFSSVEDLGMTLDLDGGLVEDLRDTVIFLPRRHR